MHGDVYVLEATILSAVPGGRKSGGTVDGRYHKLAPFLSVAFIEST